MPSWWPSTPDSCLNSPDQLPLRCLSAPHDPFSTPHIEHGDDLGIIRILYSNCINLRRYTTLHNQSNTRNPPIPSRTAHFAPLPISHSAALPTCPIQKERCPRTQHTPIRALDSLNDLTSFLSNTPSPTLPPSEAYLLPAAVPDSPFLSSSLSLFIAPLSWIC